MIGIVVAVVIVLVYISLSLKVVKQWDEMLVFTFGRYVRTETPGVHLVWSGFQRAVIVHRRIATTEFRTEGTLSKDKVPVTLMAVLFWRVVDVKRATMEVKNYQATIDLAAQTTLWTSSAAPTWKTCCPITSGLTRKLPTEFAVEPRPGALRCKT
jgi:regulator of protease activity HflC (stomatin/prohibitin superfamily)